LGGGIAEQASGGSVAELMDRDGQDKANQDQCGA